MDETFVINQMKEDVCYVAQDFYKDMKIARFVFYDIRFPYSECLSIAFGVHVHVCLGFAGKKTRSRRTTCYLTTHTSSEDMYVQSQNNQKSPCLLKYVLTKHCFRIIFFI